MDRPFRRARRTGTLPSYTLPTFRNPHTRPCRYEPTPPCHYVAVVTVVALGVRQPGAALSLECGSLVPLYPWSAAAWCRFPFSRAVGSGSARSPAIPVSWRVGKLCQATALQIAVRQPNTRWTSGSRQHRNTERYRTRSSSDSLAAVSRSLVARHRGSSRTGSGSIMAQAGSEDDKSAIK